MMGAGRVGCRVGGGGCAASRFVGEYPARNPKTDGTADAKSQRAAGRGTKGTCFLPDAAEHGGDPLPIGGQKEQGKANVHHAQGGNQIESQSGHAVRAARGCGDGRNGKENPEQNRRYGHAGCGGVNLDDVSCQQCVGGAQQGKDPAKTDGSSAPSRAEPIPNVIHGPAEIGGFTILRAASPPPDGQKHLGVLDTHGGQCAHEHP